MRILLAVAAALLAIGATSPALATSVPAATAGMTAIVQGLPATAGTGPTEIRATKKKRKKSSGKESASFEEIGSARRGKLDLEVKAKVAKEGRQCELKVKWKGGATSEDDSESKEDKICEFSIEVPNESKVVGNATAELTVKDSAGKTVATAKKTFSVK